MARRPTRRPRPRLVQPDLASFWLRYAPRKWPAPERPWVDLARGTLGEVAPPEEAPPEERRGGDDERAAVALDLPGPLDDLAYVPPVPSWAVAERDRLAARLLTQGTPVLLQLLPGDPLPAELAPGEAHEAPGEAREALVRGALTGTEPSGLVPLYDLLDPLLAGDLDALGDLPAGAVAAWPLLPGITDGEEVQRTGLERLAAAGVAAVQAVTPALPPPVRRRLAEGRSEEVFHALFHRQATSERQLARLTATAGLAPLLRRPLPAPPLTGAGNRRLAGLLLLAAELWLRLDRSVGRGLAMIRAARWIDAAGYDVAALAREGNLGIVAEIDPESRGLIEGALAGGDPPLLVELLAEYVS